LQTGKVVYEQESPEHGIEVGITFREDWCCKNSPAWDEDEHGPPCHVCPLYENEPDPFNQFCLEHWKMLDVTGRDRGFGESPLREEAIDAHLKRYGANDPEFYETLFNIEIALFSHRQEEEKKKQEREKKKSAAKAPASGGGPRKNYTAPVSSGRTASLNKKRR
tara:strand:+ start:381 stop:872 length:492 start_codon:yes stop_codon:yes gene_type:complete